MPDSEQTKSAYRRVCKQECEWCAKGFNRYYSSPERTTMFHSSLTPSLEPPDSEILNVPTCTAPSKDAFMERQAAQIAALQAALAEGGHAEDCESLGDNKAPHAGIWMWHRELMPERCNCHLAGLSDDIERGKELLGAKEAKNQAECELILAVEAKEKAEQSAILSEANLQAVKWQRDKFERERDKARATSQRQAVEIGELQKDKERLNHLFSLSNKMGPTINRILIDEQLAAMKEKP